MLRRLVGRRPWKCLDMMPRCPESQSPKRLRRTRLQIRKPPRSKRVIQNYPWHGDGRCTMSLLVDGDDHRSSASVAAAFRTAHSRSQHRTLQARTVDIPPEADADADAEFKDRLFSAPGPLLELAYATAGCLRISLI